MKLFLVALGGMIIGGVATIFAMAMGLFDPRPAPNPLPSKVWGEFSPAEPAVKLLAEGRNLQLLENFTYRDTRGKLWLAEKDSIVNGASIPQFFWSVTGGPLEGQYRNASIIHDEGCRLMKEPSADVHKMFYEACRCGGVGETKAKILFFAVHRFGPKWVIQKVSETIEVFDKDGNAQQLTVEREVGKPVYAYAAAREFDVRALEKYIAEKNPSLDELKALNPADIP